MSFWKELQERKVFRVASIYLVVMWIIIQVTADLFPAFGVPDWAMRLVYLVAILGFPVAVILGWAFELTPEGLRRDHGEYSAGSQRKGFDFVILGAVALLALFLIFRPELMDLIEQGITPVETAAIQTGAVPEPEPLVTHPQSIAVLAFDNMSSNPDTEYFSDGISEEVLNVLANIPGLHVASRTSAFAFKEREDAGIRDIARALEVSFILEGSVRRAGEQVRVTAQLIDARTDRHVWSQNYDRELREVFEIQDEIAAAIVDKLKPVILAARGGGPKISGMTTDNMEAYDLYLHGRSAFNPVDAAALESSIGQLEQSIALDPEFARAHSALARSMLALARLRNDPELRDRAIAEAETALAANPQFREAFEVRKSARDWRTADT